MSMSSEIESFKLRKKWLLDSLDDLIISLLTDGAPLTEDRIYELCDECLQTKKPQALIRALGEAFTQPAILSRCFQKKVSKCDVSEGKKKLGSNILFNIHPWR